MKRLSFLVLGLLICSSVWGQSVAKPSITPAPGTFNNSVSVTITDATPGAVIYFTTDGSTPTTASQQYNAPFTVSATSQVQAIAVLANSAVASANFTIVIPNPCATSGTAWKSLAFPSTQTGNFRIEFDATPSALAMDSVIGVSNGAASSYGALSIGARFHTGGNIDAISGTGYTPAQAIPYAAGTKYHFTLDVTGSTYAASVDSKVIGTNLPFRTAATQLTQLSYVAEIGSASICNLKISALAPPPPPLVFVTTTLPAATYGIAYSTILTAGGGKAPYVWSATGLPTGMTLSANGTFSGMPLSSGVFPVTVTDAAQATLIQNLTFTVTPKPVHSVSLTWNASANATGYNVYRAGVKLPGMPVMGPAFKDTNVTAGASYCYTVTSVGGTATAPIESGPSSQICVTIPTP